MNALPNHDIMMEALRLTREGRRVEAMTVLRRAVESAIPPVAPPDREGDLAQRAEADPPPNHSVLRDLLTRARQFGLAHGLGKPPGPAEAPAPGLLPDGASFEELLYANAAGSRAYKLYVPSRFRGQAL